jgi:hypothetical protein
VREYVEDEGDILELIAISIYLKLARIVVALQRDSMSEAANSSIFVFPCRRRDTGDTILRSNLGFIDSLLAQMTRVLIPLERVGSDGGDVHVTAKVS